MVIRAIDMDTAIRLFMSGKSKAEIGKEMGKPKKQVEKLLARAIKAKGEQRGKD